MKLLNIILLVFLAQVYVAAQPDSLVRMEISALESEVDTITKRWSEARYLNDVAKLYVKFDVVEAEKYWSKAHDICLEDGALSNAASENLIREYARSLNGLGIIHYTKRDYKSAVEFYIRSRVQYQRIDDQDHISSTYYNVGNVYMDAGSYDKAEEQYLEALDIRKKAGDIRSLINCYVQLATVKRRLEDYESSLSYARQALQLADSIEFKSGKRMAYVEIARYYTRQKDYDESLKNYQMAIDIASDEGDQLKLAENYYRMGRVSLDKTDYSAAREYLSKSVELYKVLGDKKWESTSLQHLSDAYLRMGEIELSQEIFARSQQLKRESFLLNKLQEAEDYLDSLELAQETSLLRMNVDEEKRRRNIYLYGGLIIIFLTLISSVLLYSRFRSRSRAQQKILELELANTRLQEALLNKKIRAKNEDISKLVTRVTASREHKKQIYAALEKLLKNADDEFARYVRSLMLNLRLDIQGSKSREVLNQHIDEVSSAFDNVLQEKYPELTKLEREVCAFIRIGMTTSEIMETRAASRNAIKAIRHRIRKKMGLSAEDDLRQTLVDLSIID